MIERTFVKDEVASVALYSECDQYRYALTRIWDTSGKRIAFIMLNPSTATEIQNDPTVERCERRARALGFGGFRVCNIFAYRATDPRDMRAQSDPVGQDNTSQILEAAKWADKLVCAWGTHGEHKNQGPQMETFLRQQNMDLYHLGLSKAGHPKHPLYIAYAQQLEIWPVSE